MGSPTAVWVDQLIYGLTSSCMGWQTAVLLEQQLTAVWVMNPNKLTRFQNT